VTATHDMGAVRPEEVVAAAARFVGEIDQIPPMVSAIKVGGRRLHELAREGIEIEREARRVTIHELTLDPVPVEPGVYRIAVACSSGTYIRSLAADIGHALGGGAHLRNLRRTAIGSFTVAEAVPVEAVTLLPLPEALRDLAAVHVDDELAADVRHGKVLAAERLGAEGPGPWPVLDPSGALLAVYEAHRGGTVKPAVVVA
jgi:tRNA pseudouridine55 synthase